MRSRSLTGLVLLAGLLLSLLPANAVLAAKGPRGRGQSSITGVVKTLPATADLTGDWVITSGTVDVTVSVTAATRVGQALGKVAVGATVQVSVTRAADGSFAATAVEVKRSPAGGGSFSYQFSGTIASLPAAADFAGDWTVQSGEAVITVHVTADTVISGGQGKRRGGSPATPAVGLAVHVRGNLQADGSVNATGVEVRPARGTALEPGQCKLTGTIESLPAAADLIGNWVISHGEVDITVVVTADTVINQEAAMAAVGAFVEVAGTRQADGTFTATEIVVKR